MSKTTVRIWMFFGAFLVGEMAFSLSAARLRRAAVSTFYSFDGKLVDTQGLSVRSLGAGTSQGFGRSTAISEDQSTLVIGSYFDNYDQNGANPLSQAGAVLVYVKSGGNWILQQRLAGVGTNGRLASDNFGYSVSISGDTIVVGAYLQDYDASGANMLSGAGAAYVFTRTAGVWSFQQKLVASGTNARVASDNFGVSVDISGDTIVVGADGQDYDASGANSVSAAGAAYVFTRSGGVWTQQQKLAGEGANSRIASDGFGANVAIDGDTIVVGAELQDYDGSGANVLSGAGAAYVYFRSGGVWTQQQKLVGVGTNGRVANDNFGNSVDISGETIVVGAYLQDTDGAGADTKSGAGAVFVFLRSAGVWSLQQKVVSSGTNGRIAGDRLGDYVAISGDTFVAGASYQAYDANGANSVSHAGAAFVFTRSGGVWTQQQKIVAEGTNARLTNDAWGEEGIAISGDTIVLGCYLQDYTIDGDDYISSAGAAVVKVRSGSVWSQEARLMDISNSVPRLSSNSVNLGASVALSEDGQTMVVGAPNEDFDGSGYAELVQAGAAFVYVKSGGSWILQQKLVGVGTNGRNANDVFGTSVAISGDTIVVGAEAQDYDAVGGSSVSNAGAAYVFTRTAGVWSLQQKLVGVGTNGRVSGDLFGNSVAISGDTVVVGAKGQDYDAAGANLISAAGAAYIFTRTAGVWSLQQKIVGEGTNGRLASDAFANHVAIDADTVIIGAEMQDYDAAGGGYLAGTGAAYVYTRTAGVWSLQQKLVGVGTNGRIGNDYFGNSVAVSGDTVVVGAYSQDYDGSGAGSLSNAGAAYVFVRSGGVWSLQQKLVGVGTNGRVASDYFGSSVSIEGNTIVVGAYGQNFDANGANTLSGAGAAYIFTRSGSTWGIKQKIVGTGTNNRVGADQMGMSVAIRSKRIIVGVPSQDYDAAGANLMSAAGAAYVFARP